jgi:hypothetical protein
LALLALARSGFFLGLALGPRITRWGGCVHPAARAAALLHAATRATTTLFRGGAATLFSTPATTTAFHRLC